MTGGLRHAYLEATAQILEVMGVIAIVAGAVFAILSAARGTLGHDDRQKTFDLFRTRLAKSILIGVEFLIAADIVGTVIVEPTAESLGILAMIVLVRTFLSFSLEVEIEGRWPWHRQRRRHEDD
jgi:uncharacterized membrane protein